MGLFHIPLQKLFFLGIMTVDRFLIPTRCVTLHLQITIDTLDSNSSGLLDIFVRLISLLNSQKLIILPKINLIILLAHNIHWNKKNYLTRTFVNMKVSVQNIANLSKKKK